MKKRKRPPEKSKPVVGFYKPVLYGHEKKLRNLSKTQIEAKLRGEVVLEERRFGRKLLGMFLRGVPMNIKRRFKKRCEEFGEPMNGVLVSLMNWWADHGYKRKGIIKTTRELHFATVYFLENGKVIGDDGMLIGKIEPLRGKKDTRAPFRTYERR
jgi:hypothetical protein